MPRDEPDRTTRLRTYPEWALRMMRVWETVSTVDGMSGACVVDANLLRLALDFGHDALTADDEPRDVLDAMVQIRTVLNSDREMWPETHWMSEDDWDADEQASAARRRDMKPDTDEGQDG